MSKRSKTPQARVPTLTDKRPADQKFSDDQPPTSSDYNGIEIDEWKAAIRKEVEDRFGSVPDDLIPVGKPGW